MREYCRIGSSELNIIITIIIGVSLRMLADRSLRIVCSNRLIFQIRISIINSALEERKENTNTWVIKSERKQK